MSDELKAVLEKDASLTLINQWHCWVVLQVRTPKSPGVPQVEQLLPVVFIVEQPNKPTDAELLTKAREVYGTTDAPATHTEAYRTTRVVYKKRAEESELLPEQPEEA